MLSEAQEQALLAFYETTQKIPAPTTEEWAEQAGKSYTAINRHRRILLDAGYLVTDSSRVRSTQLTEKGKRAVRKLRRQ